MLGSKHLEWRRVRLEDVVERVAYRHTPTSGTIERYVGADHVDEGNPRITRWGLTSDSTFPPTFRFRFEANTVLVHSRNIKKIAFADFRAVTGEKFFALAPKNLSELEAHYLLRVIQSETFTRFAEGQLVGSVNKFLNWGALKEYEFVLPPVEEQRLIGDLLAKIDATLKGYGNLETGSLVQSLIEEANARSGTIVSLADAVKIVGGATPSTTRPEYWNGEIPWVTPSDLTKLDAPIIRSSSRTITEQGLTNSSTKLLPIGAVLLSTRATIGFMAITEVEVCINQGVTGLVCSDRILPKFLMYLLSGMQPELLNMSSGSTFPEIGRRKLAGLKVMLPSIDDQVGVVTAIESCEKLLRAAKAASTEIGMLRARVLNDMSGDLVA